MRCEPVPRLGPSTACALQACRAPAQRGFRSAGRSIAYDWLQAPGRPAARLMVDLDRPEICSFSSGTSTCSAATVQAVTAQLGFRITATAPAARREPRAHLLPPGWSASARGNVMGTVPARASPRWYATRTHHAFNAQRTWTGQRGRPSNSMKYCCCCPCRVHSSFQHR